MADIASIDTLMKSSQQVEVTVTPEVAAHAYGDQDYQKRAYPDQRRWQAKIVDCGPLGLLVEVYTPFQASRLFLPWTSVLTVRVATP